MTLYLDCEWTIDQEIFLIGFAFADGRSGSLQGQQLHRQTFLHLLQDIKYILVYGPDIAYLEKYFDLELKSQFVCINVLKLFRQVLPGLPSYRLSYIEQLFSVGRKKRKYKTSVFTIWNDWADPVKREHVIIYNKEDVVNLRKLFLLISRRFNLSDQEILTCRLV